MNLEHLSLVDLSVNPQIAGEYRAKSVDRADELDNAMWDKGFALRSSGKKGSPLFEYVPIADTPLSNAQELVRRPYVCDRPVYRDERALDSYFTEPLEALPFTGGNEHGAVVLRAMRRSGATTTLYKYLDELKEKEIVPVYINMIIFEGSGSYTAEKMNGFMARTIESRIREDYPKESEQLKVLEGEMSSEEFGKFMGRIRGITGDKLVVIMDDADILGENVLADNPTQKIFPPEEVGKIFKTLLGNDIPLVMRTGDRLETGWVEQLKQIDQDRVVEHQMRLLSPIEVDALVRPPQAPFRYQQDAVRELYKMTGGHPAITQLFAAEALRQWALRKTDDVVITPDHIKEVASELFKEKDLTGYFNYILTYSTTVKGQSVLKRLSQTEAIKESDIQTDEKGEVKRLVDSGILTNTDGVIQFRIGFLNSFLTSQKEV